MSNLESVKALWPEWTIGRMIGEGSFGAVYEMHRDMLGASDQAALKVLSIPQKQSDVDELRSDGYREESIRERYNSHLKDIAREYKTMAELKGHTNIVYCDDLRFLPNANGIGGDITIKMELLTSLSNHLSGQLLVDDKTVIQIGIDICKALAICRANKIIHRDIKPQNIFVSRDGNYKLGDFGIARATEGTSSGTRTGTYKYMAPEVYNNTPYGAAVDIYSLGMVLYWLLNERRGPFLPLPPENTTYSQEEKANAQRFTGKKLPPPAHGSKELQAVVLKACAYNPKNRYVTPEDMQKALEQALAAAKKPVPIPVTDMPEPNPDDRTIGLWDQKAPKPEPQSKNPLWIALGCAAAVLLAAILVFLPKDAPPENIEPEVPVLQEPEIPEPLPEPAPVTEPETPPVVEVPRTWKTEFQEILTDLKETNRTYSDSDCYSLYDLTADGVPELFLSDSENYLVYQFADGASTQIGELPKSDEICPLEGTSALLSVTNSEQKTTIHYSFYEDGKLVTMPVLNEESVNNLGGLSMGMTHRTEDGYLSVDSLETHDVKSDFSLDWEQNPETDNMRVWTALRNILPSCQTADPDFLNNEDHGIAPWKVVFREQLEKHAAGLTYIDSNKDTYCLHDATGDDVPELFIQIDGKYQICRYYDGVSTWMDEAPGYPAILCPWDEYSGFISLTQGDKSESLIGYPFKFSYFAFIETPVFDNVPLESLPQPEGVPATAYGYHHFDTLQLYTVTDPDGMEWRGNPETNNSTYFWDLKDAATYDFATGYLTYENKERGLRCPYPETFQPFSISDNPWYLQHFHNWNTGENIEICYQKFDSALTGPEALELFLSEHPDRTVDYQASGEGWYAASVSSPNETLYRKALIKENGHAGAWFEYLIPADVPEDTYSDHIEYLEKNFTVTEPS